jgi:hypothetical protein
MRARHLLAWVACALSLAACANESTRPPLRQAPTVRVAATHQRAARAPVEAAQPSAGARLVAVKGPPLGQATAQGPALRPFTSLVADYELPPLERKRHAREDKLATVTRLFDIAGVSFPPAELVLRAYKQERELEVWASSQAGERMRHVTTYRICATSGELGPKRQEGDRQVPEGFYTIHYLWPNSAFYMAMKVGYPNRSDRILGGPEPGGDIMIHGGCASIGCLAMSDERIQELWVMAEPVQAKSGIRIHILPTREPDTLVDRPDYERHRDFWETLYRGDALFEASGRMPEVNVSWNGRYEFGGHG